jgi:hypothetical protein
LASYNLSFADSKVEKEAEIFLNITGMKSSMERSIEVSVQGQLNQNPKLKPFKQIMLKFYKKYMSYESLKRDLIKIYAETFTEIELREINKFYRTPIGQKTIQIMPELMAKGAYLGSQRITKNMKELKQLINTEYNRIDNLKEK